MSLTIIPTRQTRELARDMIRTAQQENGADAVLLHYDDLAPDQVAALVGVLLAEIASQGEAPIRVRDMVIDGCRDCHRSGLPHSARGLCSGCYHRHKVAGTLDQFRPLRRRTADTIDNYADLRRQGMNMTQAAERLGMTRDALQKAIERDRKQRAAEMGPQPDMETAKRRRAVLAETYRETSEGAA